MTLPIEELRQLVWKHGAFGDDDTGDPFEILINDVVWRASGSIKATAPSAVEAFAQVWAVVDELIQTAGRSGTTMKLGVAYDRAPGDAWRGWFFIVFPILVE